MADLTKEFLAVQEDIKNDIKRESNKKPRRTLEDLKTKYHGERGTARREQFEIDLSLDVISEKIKEMRKSKNLTQEQLGDIIGVQKAQISKLEKGSRNVTVETITKVFKALHATVRLKIETDPIENLSIHI
ncbi:helix-turn-helix domain-containing protein [Rufibacter immobilis]|uniref:helix-turn-helix domain-containing protein n=1 Tax=Rufibacter immobilis TaxID=1348778 RepID=UPI0035E4BF16